MAWMTNLEGNWLGRLGGLPGGGEISEGQAQEDGWAGGGQVEGDGPCCEEDSLCRVTKQRAGPDRQEAAGREGLMRLAGRAKAWWSAQETRPRERPGARGRLDI